MRIALLTSGGDSPGMNAAIRAVVRQAIAGGHDTLGFAEGYRGLAEKDYVELDSRAVSEIIDRGGTILRTARFTEFLQPDVRLKAFNNLKEMAVDALIVVGGEGSMRGADHLVELGANVIGVPASIDNDIYGTDFSIGFDTAVNNVIDVLGKLRDTASAHERVFVVEVMGRQSGAIAMTAGLTGGADYICLPNRPATGPDQIERMGRLIENRFDRGKSHTLIIVAEGAGSAEDVAEALQESTGHKIEIRVSVLGHLQRGGSPTAMDRLLATRLAAYAVRLAAEGTSGVMVGLIGNELKTTPLKETFGKTPEISAELKELAKVLA